MKKMSLVLFLSFYIGAFTLISAAFAVEDEDILYPTITTKEKYPATEEEALTVLRDKTYGDLKLDLSASVLGGYDTNIYLEHYDTVDSFFMQESFTARSAYPLSEVISLRGTYDIVCIKYVRSSEPDLLDNVLRGGLDVDIAEDVIWSLDYITDFVRYPHHEQGEYTMNAVETSLRHDITDSLYQKGTYTFSYKHYPKWKVRNGGGTYFLGDREDTRHTIGHEAGLYLDDRTFIRANNEFYFNNSNEPYLDYYDYRVFKARATVIHLITDKFYESANMGYQYETHESRNLSDRPDDIQKNHIWMAGVSLFYDITPLVTVGTSFDYRKNNTNEGALNYTDFIISGGIYCTF